MTHAKLFPFKRHLFSTKDDENFNVIRKKNAKRKRKLILATEIETENASGNLDCGRLVYKYEKKYKITTFVTSI